MNTVYIYCHGFASSPGSKKAVAFAQRFQELGKELIVPDLEDGDFRNITLSRQVEKIRSVIDTFSSSRVGIIGSSMGGYLASLVAQSRQEVKGLYLMCPGFHFLKRWKERVGRDHPESEGLPKTIQVYHYRYAREMELSTALFEDARAWDALPLDRALPIRIVHGVHDDTVPVTQSREFAASRPWVTLKELDSDHGLLSHMDWIVNDCLEFFTREGL
ncbi:YqiA/YcfP family alpha/beta fold hydrolase [Nitrospina gracilis]|uniref:YqiA/YcfP family alpha/beta fold hydrolase n=1 Tax=Nitrospina gracilis TaxID=35801 RepID=UPI001F3571C1|nr:YqiA/YcfP family alpha/beta fold hydrolase [Nitrospina gracilis]MCF8720474.1 pimeloyl-ACP methyl ester carboxylesterase [Nitrospina gracilis Nb-211]